MENVSQVVIRNLGRLPSGNSLLINPAPDGLFREIARQSKPVALSTGSFADFRNLLARGANVRFEPVPSVPESPGSVIMVLPKEKDKLSMQLHAASESLDAGGCLWLVGENRAGIKSSPRVLERYFAQVEKLDSARHCALFRATEPVAGGPFDLDEHARNWNVEFAGRQLQLCTLPGVFAHGRLDRGTELLLRVLETLQPGGRVLDFASGCGVVGLSALVAGGHPEVLLLDDSALAIESGKRTFAANGLEAASLPSDGLSELSGRFDWIVSNPPFHRGVGNDLDIASRFFRDAGTFLGENGRILVVFNRHLPYSGWLRNSFKRVDCLAQNRAFTVILASDKK